MAADPRWRPAYALPSGEPGRHPALRTAGLVEIERRATAYGLPPIAWPNPYPADTLTAMRAAVFAQQHGRAREFARAAFRLAFVEGQDLTVHSSVSRAAALAGLGPAELEDALSRPGPKQSLRNANDEAIHRGVYGVSTVEVDDML